MDEKKEPNLSGLEQTEEEEKTDDASFNIKVTDILEEVPPPEEAAPGLDEVQKQAGVLNEQQAAEEIQNQQSDEVASDNVTSTLSPKAEGDPVEGEGRPLTTTILVGGDKDSPSDGNETEGASGQKQNVVSFEEHPLAAKVSTSEGGERRKRGHGRGRIKKSTESLSSDRDLVSSTAALEKPNMNEGETDKREGEKEGTELATSVEAVDEPNSVVLPTANSMLLEVEATEVTEVMEETGEPEAVVEAQNEEERAQTQQTETLKEETAGSLATPSQISTKIRQTSSEAFPQTPPPPPEIKKQKGVKRAVSSGERKSSSERWGFQRKSGGHRTHSKMTPPPPASQSRGTTGDRKLPSVHYAIDPVTHQRIPIFEGRALHSAKECVMSKKDNETNFIQIEPEGALRLPQSKPEETSGENGNGLNSKIPVLSRHDKTFSPAETPDKVSSFSMKPYYWKESHVKTILRETPSKPKTPLVKLAKINIHGESRFPFTLPVGGGRKDTVSPDQMYLLSEPFKLQKATWESHKVPRLPGLHATFSCKKKPKTAKSPPPKTTKESLDGHSFPLPLVREDEQRMIKETVRTHLRLVEELRNQRRALSQNGYLPIFFPSCIPCNVSEKYRFYTSKGVIEKSTRFCGSHDQHRHSNSCGNRFKMAHLVEAFLENARPQPPLALSKICVNEAS